MNSMQDKSLFLTRKVISRKPDKYNLPEKRVGIKTYIGMNTKKLKT